MPTTLVLTFPWGLLRALCATWRTRAAELDDVSRAERAAFLRVTFGEPVVGPVALGHLSHFGLGLFVPKR